MPLCIRTTFVCMNSRPNLQMLPQQQSTMHSGCVTLLATGYGCGHDVSWYASRENLASISSASRLISLNKKLLSKKPWRPICGYGTLLIQSPRRSCCGIRKIALYSATLTFRNFIICPMKQSEYEHHTNMF